jgi:glycosyltransferase involved in cell wall biosynthesis
MEKSQVFWSPLISVVIPAYNEETKIARCLQSVLNQKTNLKYEVIVADSSTDRTPEIIKENFPTVILIHSKKRMYRGKARNVGINAARGEIIVCLDSDCVVADEYWLDKIHETHKKHAVVGARVCNGNPRNLFGWSIFLLEFCEWITKRDKIMRMLLSYNVSYKRQIFDKYGLFPDHDAINEDLIFHSRIKEKLFFSSKVMVKHINRTDFFEVVRHCFKLGRGAAFARKQYQSIPGSFFVKYPVLIGLLPFARFFLSGFRSLQANYFLIFLLVSPLIFINSISYSIGFLISAVFKD